MEKLQKAGGSLKVDGVTDYTPPKETKEVKEDKK